MIKVSADGTECTTYKECADLLKKGEDIDYNGVSGPVDLGKTGSPTKATIGISAYGQTTSTSGGLRPPASSQLIA